MDETRRATEGRFGYNFTVPGKPRGKGRPRFRRAGNFVQTYTPADTAAYENLVALEYQAVGGKLLEGPVEVYVTAWYPIPKNLSKAKRAEMDRGMFVPHSKPDADNVLKAVLDGLNGVAYKDDTQVQMANILRLYSDSPRVAVQVEEGNGRFLK